MILSWLFKKIFKALSNFFSTKAGKTTAKVMAGVGATAAVAGGVQFGVAHSRNKRAERIKANAIKKHNEARAIVERTLVDLGQTKLNIYKSFGDLADAIEKIQQRPDFELDINGTKLTSFKQTGLKQISTKIETIVGGVGGMAAGSAIGAAVMGTGTILALAPGALLGGVVLCAMGTKSLQQSADNVKLAKKIERDVESIVVYYNELDNEAKKFNKTFLKVQEPFFKHINKVQKIVARKTEWESFSKAEKLAVKNAISFAQILIQMCSVQLIQKNANCNAIEKVNTVGVTAAINNADVFLRKTAAVAV